jgi:hypothetical protein
MISVGLSAAMQSHIAARDICRIQQTVIFVTPVVLDTCLVAMLRLGAKRMFEATTMDRNRAKPFMHRNECLVNASRRCVGKIVDDELCMVIIVIAMHADPFNVTSELMGSVLAQKFIYKRELCAHLHCASGIQYVPTWHLLRLN